MGINLANIIAGEVRSMKTQISELVERETEETEFNELIRNAEELIEKTIKELPDELIDIEKIEFYHEKLNKLNNSDKIKLRRVINYLFRKARELEASDMDIGGNGCKGFVWYRVKGLKKPFIELGGFNYEFWNFLSLSILTEKQRNYLIKNKNLDFSYQIIYGDETVRFRCDIYFDLGNLALNARRINSRIFPLKELGFHPNIAKYFSLRYHKRGLILVTGITGSGKSTTLDSIIDANNQTVDSHIIIIASPVEYIHRPKRCIIRHREVGRDVNSFKEGAIQALRQDPDIIVVGEMRDPETITTVLEVTDSGHKVFSTLHTSSAVESIDRIIAECPNIIQDRVRNRLADVLTVVVSQKLVPTLNGDITLAKEVLLVTPSVKAAIKNNNLDEIYQMISEGGKYGMITMEQDLKRLYMQRKISLETAYSFANNKRRMEELFKNL